MNDPKQLAILLAKNTGVTVASLLLWLIIGYAGGSVAAGAQQPDAAQFLARGGSVSTSSLEKYYETRNGVVNFCGWCGLICAQVVFLASQFGNRTVNSPVGAFPVKELGS